VLIPALTTPIPNSLSYEEAVVLPVGIATASAGLFQSDFLSLPLPTLSPKQTNSVILIWGGSSAIGCSGIQLARAAGLQVITTASKHNFQLCKDLGAAEVFGRASPSITNEILEYLEGKDFLGVYDAIGLPDTLEACVEIMAKRKPGGIIASTLPPMVAIDAKGIQIKMGKSKSKPHSSLAVLYLSCQSKLTRLEKPQVHCLKIIDNVAPAIFNDYLPKALEQGKFLAKPDPLVVGTGLEFVQKGMDRVKEGYSARKVVVKL
jgi:NADPH:quinone reductase-like Zn-dependent oxidoreductase